MKCQDFSIVRAAFPYLLPCILRICTTSDSFLCCPWCYLHLTRRQAKMPSKPVPRSKIFLKFFVFPAQRRKNAGAAGRPPLRFYSLFVITFVASGGQYMTADTGLIGSQRARLAGPSSHMHEHIHPCPAFGTLDLRKSGCVFSLVASIQQHPFSSPCVKTGSPKAA